MCTCARVSASKQTQGGRSFASIANVDDSSRYENRHYLLPSVFQTMTVFAGAKHGSIVDSVDSVDNVHIVNMPERQRCV